MATKRAPKKMEKRVGDARPQSILLTEMQGKLVDGLLLGKDPDIAAKDAGYSTRRGSGAALTKPTAVQEALRQAREELSSAAQITRADVIDGIMEGINLARLGAEPATMIKGWSEIAKMLGLYAPEVKEIKLSDSQARIQDKFRYMTDAELLSVIDGESHRVEED